MASASVALELGISTSTQSHTGLQIWLIGTLQQLIIELVDEIWLGGFKTGGWLLSSWVYIRALTYHRVGRLYK